jgi:hypothetical protein
VGLMFIAYNLRRICNILTLNVLKEYLRMLVALFLTIFVFTRAILMHFEEQGVLTPEFAVSSDVSGENRHYRVNH